MSAAAHTEFVGSDWMPCRCTLQRDHTREEYIAFFEDGDQEPGGLDS